MICIRADIAQEICDIDDELNQFITIEIQFVFGFLKIEKIETDFWMKLLV